MRTSRWLIALALVAIAGTAFIRAQGHGAMQNMAEAKWGPAPDMLPPGAEIAVLSGDPTKSAPYAVRLRFPANYDIPAHSHPTDENVVVTSGSLFLGMGDTLDRTKGTPFAVGGFAVAPAGMNHYAYTKARTTIVLYGQGPVEIKYVNPADDPRNRK
jgi:hypothetical protein